MIKFTVVIGLLAITTAICGAEEKNISVVETTPSPTTLSGYVDTSVAWAEPTEGAINQPQVATNKLRKIPNWGTDILHYFVRDSFTNAGVVSNATGYLHMWQQAQGHSARQQLFVYLRKLGTNETFTLLSAREGETNYTEATTFNSDRWGNARLTYRKQSNGKANGKGHDTLPESLDPLIELASLGVANSSTQLVMHADLLNVDRMQYHVKRKMEGYYGVGGLMHLTGTTRKSFFRLQALNLLPTNSYWLAFNGEVVSTNSTDRNGYLRIFNTLDPAVTPFTLKTVEVLDSGTNTLLYTELP